MFSFAYPVGTRFVNKKTNEVFILFRGSMSGLHCLGPELAGSYKFDIHHKSKVSGTLHTDIFQTNTPEQPTGFWKNIAKSKTTSEDEGHQLFSLLMFIGSCDLCVNGISYVYIYPPHTSIDIFNFVVSCGFNPKTQDILNFVEAQASYLCHRSELGDFNDIISFRTKVQELGWISSTSMGLSPGNSKPLEWHINNKPPMSNLWSCPVVILRDNLQKIFDESFDLESSF